MKNLAFVLMAFLGIIHFSLHLNAQNTVNPTVQQKEEDGYLVYFKPDVSQHTIDSLLDKYNSSQVWITTYSKVRYWKVNQFPFTVDDSITIGNIQELYDTWVKDNDDEEDEESEVGSIGFNYKIKKGVPSIIPESDNNYNSDQCPQFFNSYSLGKSNVTINILDTGLDFGNNNINLTNFSGQYNFVSGNGYAQDDNGHGTHITSIINSLSGLYQDKISIFESKTHNSEGKGKLSDIVRAIDYSIENGSNIINASWTYYAKANNNKTPVQIAIETAGQYGILFVTAAGNESIDNDNNTLKAFPASFDSDNILAVSSNSCDTTLSYFSNYGFSRADICAIGENIPGYVLNNQLGLLSGTSQATAYVSAVAAIIGTHLDNFDPLEVKQLILDGAKYNTNLEKLVKTEAVIDCNASLDLIGNGNMPFENKFTNINSTKNTEKLEAYPNPFTNYLNIELNSEKEQSLEIELYNINGKLILSEHYKINSGSNEIKWDNMDYLKPGFYYIKAGLLIKKLFKTK